MAPRKTRNRNYRLPVKSLLRFKSICKLWNSRISSRSRDFIKTHLFKSTNDPMAPRRKVRNRNRNCNPSLPEHIIYESLSRLPVKSLLRFKSVCKSWHSLISSRDFIKTHLVKSTNDPHFTHHKLILCDAPFLNHEYRSYIDFRVRARDRMLLSSYPVHSLLNETFTKLSGLDYPMKNMDNWTYVVGYCNGLVCLACFDGSAYLWNPSTRKSSILPKYKHAHTVFGFGYDESNDDFKVYTIIGKKEYEVSVYSSNSDCWKRIDGAFPIEKESLEWSRGMLAHGAIHWVFRKGRDFQEKIIVSLDMKTEIHGEVLQPNYGKDVYDLTLGTFDNSLSVLCQDNTGADLWVVKEYGVEQSWTKLFTFPIPDSLPWKPRIRPICISVNGDIMLLVDSNVILYNPENNKFMFLFEKEENPSYNMFQELNVYTYVESLVSPKSKSELKFAANIN